MECKIRSSLDLGRMYIPVSDAAQHSTLAGRCLDIVWLRSGEKYPIILRHLQSHLRLCLTVLRQSQPRSSRYKFGLTILWRSHVTAPLRASCIDLEVLNLRSARHVKPSRKSSVCAHLDSSCEGNEAFDGCSEAELQFVA